jgi:hypothetical protein
MQSDSDQDVSNLLCSFDLASVFELLRFVSRYDTRSANSITTLRFASQDTPELHNRLSLAFSVFEDWPTNFYAFLTRICSKTISSRAKAGLNSSFGNFYQDLMRRGKQSRPFVNPLKAAFGTYVANYWDHGYINRTEWLRRMSDDRKYVSRRDACDELNVDPRILDRLVKEGRLTAVVKKPGGMRVFLVDKNSLDELKRSYSPDVSLEAAARFLGLTRANVLRLVAHHLIVPVMAPSVADSNHWRFDQAALEKFLNGVRSKITAFGGSHLNDLQKFDRVLARVNERLSILGYGIHTLVDDILHGRLVPRGESSDQRAISRLVFSQDEVGSYISVREHGRNGERLQMKAISSRFQLKPEILWFLVDKGLISMNSKINDGVRCKAITAEAVFEFTSKYVLEDELARQAVIRTDDLRKHLAQKNIKPISGCSVDYGPKYVFGRSDVNKLDLRKINRSCQQRKNKLRERNSVGVVEAAKILSVQTEVIVDMVRNDILKPYPDLARSEINYRFNRNYIEGYKGQFRNPASLISKRAAGHIVGKYNLHCRWLRLGYLKFMISKDGKKRFLVKTDVEKIASVMAALATRAEAAEWLGVPQAQVEFWTRKDLLRTVKNRFTKAFKITFYSKQALANFKVIDHCRGRTKRILVKLPS